MGLINKISFKVLGDNTGSLIALNGSKDLPFDIKRVYYIFGTKKGISRGFHAHIDLSQVIVCLKGRCRFILDDGKHKEETILNDPTKGLIIDGLVWREMYDFSPDCILLVLANSAYAEDDYIRNYEKFIEEVERKNSE